MSVCVCGMVRVCGVCVWVMGWRCVCVVCGVVMCSVCVGGGLVCVCV